MILKVTIVILLLLNKSLCTWFLFLKCLERLSINFHIFENFSFYYYRHYLLRLRCSFFSIWVLFHEHSRFTGLQRKGQANSELLLPLLYHFHSLHRHLDISRATTAESLRLYLAGGLEREHILGLGSLDYY